MPHDSILSDPLLLWTTIISNAVLAIACIVIFVFLRIFIHHKKDQFESLIFQLIGSFFFVLGLVQLAKIWNLYQPFHWLKTSLEICTAILALFSTIALWRLMPRAFKSKKTYELELANEKLRQTETHFKLLVSGIEDYAIYMVDPEGIIMTWNEGAENVKGYTADEIIGKNFSCFFCPEDRQAGKPQWEIEMAKKNGHYEEEALRQRKDGSQFWADIHITAIYDENGQLTGFAKVTRDITQKKQAAKILEEQVALLDLSSDAIIMRDLNGIIRYWNRGAQKIYGYSKEEALGKKSHALLKTEFPKPLPEIERDILALKRWDGELIHYNKTGDRLIIESRQSLKIDEAGSPAGILEINTDITSRKEAEQKQYALSEMERVNSDLEQFASIASHDLQEPLRAIAGCLHILEKTYQGRLDKNADELIHYAVDGSQRMRALINDLLLFSRVGREQMTISTLDTQKVLQQAKTSLAAAIAENDVTITTNDMPVVSANATLLTLLFQNLISNAIKFRSSAPPKIIIDANHQNGHWLFSVTDNGIGFDQVYANQIFQPFKRLHSKDTYPGTGIGLPICKKIIERHGGNIWTTSQPGHGTTFHFSIPDPGKVSHEN